MIVYVTNNKEPWTLKLLLCFYKLFGLSFWRHPFTAEDPLVSKLYKAKFLKICSDEDKKNIYILDCLRVSQIYTTFYFGWTIPLNSWRRFFYWPSVRQKRGFYTH